MIRKASVEKRVALIVASVCLLLCALPDVVTAADKKKAKKPPPVLFPEVKLKDLSDPRYATLKIDAFTNRAAYVLFDGNLKDGYKRIYVWVPDDIKFKRPVSYNALDTQAFPTLTFKSDSKEKNQAVVLSWQVKWAKHTSGGGTRTSVNYVTGEKKTTTSQRRSYSVFSFSVNYARGKRGGLHRPGQYPLDLLIPGRLPISAAKTNMPSAYAPWNNLYFYMSSKAVHAKKDEDTGRIFNGRLRHYSHGHWDVKVRSLPEDAVITLAIAPYLENAVYDQRVTMKEVFIDGLFVPMPYGWYTYRWDFKCSGISVRPVGHGNWVGLNAFSRPAPGVAGIGKAR